MKLLNSLNKTFWNWIADKVKSVAIGMTRSDYSDSEGVAHAQDFLASEEAYKVHLWTYLCTRTVASALARLPVKLYREQKGDDLEIDNHQILDILQNPQPNLGSRTQFYESVFGFKYLSDNLYLYTQYGTYNQPAELILFRPSRVKIKTDPKLGIGGYILDNGNGTKTEFNIEYKKIDGSLSASPVVRPGVTNDGAKILHIKGFNPTSDVYGLSRIAPGTMNINTDLQSRKFNYQHLKNRAIPPAILEVEKNLNEAEAKRLKLEFDDLYKGATNAGKTAVLWNGAKINTVGETPSTMGWAEQIEFIRDESVALGQTPPSIVGLYKWANYANAEVQRKDFWENTLIPLASVIQEGFNQQWIARHFPKEKEAGFYMMFDFSGVQALQEDMLRKSKKNQILFVSGLQRRNEGRVDMGLEPLPGEDRFIEEIKGTIGDQQNQTQDNVSVQSVTKAIETKDVSRETLRQAHEAKLQRNEERLRKVVAKFFTGQRDRVLDHIASDPDYNKPNVDNINAYMLALFEMNLKSIDDWFNDPEEIEIMMKEIVPVIELLFQDNAQDVLDGLGVEVNINMDNPAIRGYLQGKYNTLFPEVTIYTRNKLRNILQQSVIDGETIAQIQERIVDRFGLWIEGEPNSMSRALRIARTETNSVLQASSQIAYKESGVVKQKEWIVADADARMAHLDADGQKAGIDEPYSVGGENLMFPGDPNGSPENVINCRCDSIAIVEE